VSVWCTVYLRKLRTHTHTQLKDIWFDWIWFEQSVITTALMCSRLLVAKQKFVELSVKLVRREWRWSQWSRYDVPDTTKDRRPTVHWFRCVESQGHGERQIKDDVVWCQTLAHHCKCMMMQVDVDMQSCTRINNTIRWTSSTQCQIVKVLVRVSFELSIRRAAASGTDWNGCKWTTITLKRTLRCCNSPVCLRPWKRCRWWTRSIQCEKVSVVDRCRLGGNWQSSDVSHWDATVR